MGKTTELLRSSLETLWRVPTRVFGSRNERLLKTYAGSVARINALEPEFSIEVVRDPTGCNTDPVYGLDGERHEISVYRRPRPAMIWSPSS